MRYLIVILLFLMIQGTTMAQKPAGRYVYTQPDLGMELRFEGKRFTSLSFQHDTIKGKGTYEIKGNELVLQYDKIDIDTSEYVIRKRKGTNTGIGMIVLEVYDRGNNNLPLYFASSILQDKAGAIVVQNYTDTLGKVNFSIHNDKAIDRVYISALGYQGVTLPVAGFMGYSTSLKVYLKPVQGRYINGRTVKYRIETINSNDLILVTSDGNKLHFKKEKK